MKFEKSVITNAKLEPLFTIGDIYVSDFIKDGESPKYPPSKLELAFDPISKAAQLTEQPCREAMWGSQYWYLSSTNRQMKIALKNVARYTINCLPPNQNKEVFLDIAGNDSTLLSYVNKNKFTRVNIDPSDYPNAKNNAEVFIQDFFSKKSYFNSGLPPARYITCCAMLYDTDKPNEFLQDVYAVLKHDGVFVVQVSYTPLMLIQTELGNICHEHLCYYNLTSLKYLLETNGFIIRDVELNNVNGGSIRIYAQKNIAPNNFKTPADQDIANIKIQSLLDWEEKEGYNSPQKYLEFFRAIQSLKEKTLNFLAKCRKEGKRVYGYGASTKASTLYQYFGINSEMVTKIAEVQERKVGLRTIGTNIPICSEDEMRKERPDYLLVGPWFFLDNFKAREEKYLKQGGAFILTSPRFSIYKN